VRNTINNHVYMWWVNPQNVLSSTDLGVISPQWHVVATADYNGDGYTDIVWQNTSTGQMQLWDMGSYSSPSNSSLTSSSAMIAGSALQAGGSAAANSGNMLINGTLAVDVSTLTFSGAGTVTLAGATIEGSAAGETLVNAGDTISGTGTIGDGSGKLALDNASGIIQAAGGTLVLDTGTPITNAGTLNATNGATLLIDDAVTGTGSATIGNGATLELAAADSGSVVFTGPTGTLKLDNSPAFTGTISGFGAQDVIDLAGIAFGAHTTLGYSPNSNQTAGTLSITNGAQSVNIALLGNYMASSFVTASDGHGGTMVSIATAQSQSLLTNPHS
jgi:FG-GAP repeat